MKPKNEQAKESSGVGQFINNILSSSKTVYFLLGTLILLVILFVILVFPVFNVTYYLSQDLISPSEIPTIENNYRRTYAQIIGGIVLLVGLWFTYRRIVATEKNVEIAQKNLLTVQKGEITERLTGAIEHLNSTSLSKKIGGIYGLKRIAEEDEDSRETIIEILSSYMSEQVKEKDQDIYVSLSRGSELKRSSRDVLQSFFTILDLNKADNPVAIYSTRLIDFVLDGKKLEGVIFAELKLAKFKILHLHSIGANFSDTLFAKGLIDDSTFDKGLWRDLMLYDTVIYNNSFIQIMYKEITFQDCEISLNEYLTLSSSFFCTFKASEIDNNSYIEHSFIGNKFHKKSTLVDNKFIGCKFERCSFNEVTLSQNSFIQCEFNASSFKRSNLNENVFKDCVFNDSIIFKDNEVIDNEFLSTDLDSITKDREFLSTVLEKNTVKEYSSEQS